MTSSVHPPAPAEHPAAGAGRAPARVLTSRQRAVLTALAAGYTEASAARRLGMSTRTVRRVGAAAAARLGTDIRVHAIALAAAAGELDMGAVRERRVPPWRDEPRTSNRQEAAAARRARYVQLRASGLTRVQAAAVLGVSPETCRNYSAWAADVERGRRGGDG